jgi:hypothetical protein
MKMANNSGTNTTADARTEIAYVKRRLFFDDLDFFIAMSNKTIGIARYMTPNVFPIGGFDAVIFSPILKTPNKAIAVMSPSNMMMILFCINIIRSPTPFSALLIVVSVCYTLAFAF